MDKILTQPDLTRCLWWVDSWDVLWNVTLDGLSRFILTHPAPMAARPVTKSGKDKPNGKPAMTPQNIAALAARNLGGFVPNKIFVGGVPITCTEDRGGK
eukprot:5398674-Amphidinium_carterae.2